MTLTLLVAALVALQVVPPAPPSAEALGRAYFLFLEGKTLEGEDDLAGAINSYRQAIELLPGSAALRVELAMLHARQNQIADAERAAEAALVAEPDNRDAHRLLGRIKAAAVDARPANPTDMALVGQAVSHLERAIEGGPSEPGVELLLYSLYIRQDRAALAVERLTALAAAQPEYQPAALRLLVKAHEALGQGEDARRRMAELATVPPDPMEKGVRNIERLERMGRWADAATGWSQIVGFDPSGTIYRAREAAALANAGNLSDARAVIGVATRELPRSISAWYVKGLIEGRAGDVAAADEAAARIGAIDPRDGRGPLAAARARAAAGDDRGVVAVLGPRLRRPSATEVSSGLIVEIASTLSAAYERLGDTGRALSALEDARKYVPANQDLLFMLGAAYEENRRYDRAERAFRDLIAVNESHAPALNYLGYMLADRGEKLPEALELVKRALTIDEDNPAYLDSLAWAYFRLGQFEAARDPLERAARALPKVSVIQDHLGDLYLQLKRYDDAASAFDRALSGDGDGIDPAVVTKKRDRARGLAAQP